MGANREIEKRLWSGADTLRANSNFASNEYFLPVMGLIFLRHAYSRFLRVKGEIEGTLPTRGGIGFTGTPLFKADEITRRVFGNYVSRYGFQRAVEDEATVPLYYDARGEKLGVLPARTASMRARTMV